MDTVASNTIRIDVEHRGNQQVIAACLLTGESGAAIVDPGPASALPVLKRKLAQCGLSVADLNAILLTHIHLDHAGATGTLVAENPRIGVFVHERGAPHMAQPDKLLASAQRLYGEEMDRLWGEFRAVPAENLNILKGGERIRAGGRAIEVEYTPGHASHHVTYFDSSNGLAFVGDTAGIRISNRKYIVPPTPPPDIDLETWGKSLDRILSRKPSKLFLTHFSTAEPVEVHLAELRERLARWAEMVRETLSGGADDAGRASQFAQNVLTEMRGQLSEQDATRYAKGAGLDLCWAGLARYWRKRGT
ncbi:MAG: MBL fold metallo-hydrolase [Acidobacteria bacterium]|nr:MBL fold metallo-hydrolase [Acidobacteriota bacterium]MBI3662956.1 MBL fold metallo-hydrolase [Acidobacteriota bacterium]